MSRFTLHVSDIPDVHLLMGYALKGDTVSVEDNLVNRLVLGMDTSLNEPWYSTELKYGKSLLDFQVPDVKRMMMQKHILNANPMGLGKTIETIVALREIDARRCIIVVPKILKHQWRMQFHKWWPFAPEITVIESTRDKNLTEMRKASEGIFIFNYEQITNQSVLEAIRSRRWDVCVLDEAHRIKNRKSQRSIAVKSIPAERRWALTGTPILRYVDDLWSILNYLGTFYSGISYWNFVNYFCKVEETFWGKKIAGITDDPAKVAILNKMLQLIFIRNEQVSVAQGKVAETIHLPMTKKMTKLYAEAKALVLDSLPENMTVPNGAVLTLRLRQVTSWPGLYIDGEVGPKFEYIKDTLSSNPDEKVVVFTIFAKTANALVEYLNKAGLKTVGIIGTNDAHENACSKIDFVEGDAQCLVGTIAAMGQGYDGLQDVSRRMIMMERDWSPEINQQCEDRLHRMGQKLPVLIQYLECDGSFDKKVTRINITKADDIRAALESD